MRNISNDLLSILQVKKDVSDSPRFSVLMRGNKNYKPVVFLRAEKPNVFHQKYLFHWDWILDQYIVT